MMISVVEIIVFWHIFYPFLSFVFPTDAVEHAAICGDFIDIDRDDCFIENILCHFDIPEKSYTCCHIHDPIGSAIPKFYPALGSGSDTSGIPPVCAAFRSIFSKTCWS